MLNHFPLLRELLLEISPEQPSVLVSNRRDRWLSIVPTFLYQINDLCAARSSGRSSTLWTKQTQGTKTCSKLIAMSWINNHASVSDSGEDREAERRGIGDLETLQHHNLKQCLEEAKFRCTSCHVFSWGSQNLPEPLSAARNSHMMWKTVYTAMTASCRNDWHYLKCAPRNGCHRR